MSQRLGMADGRCFTINSSAQLTNNYLMEQNGISFRTTTLSVRRSKSRVPSSSTSFKRTPVRNVIHATHTPTCLRRTRCGKLQ